MNSSIQISKKDTTYIAAAANEAFNSPILMRHGAVAVANGRIIAKGYNHHRSTAHTGAMGGCTCHAECAVLHKLLKLKNSNQAPKTKRITIYITRIGQNGELRESAPCHDCYEKMLFFGIKTIVFTKEIKFNQNINDDHEISIVKCNLEDFNPTVITAGQRWISKITS